MSTTDTPLKLEHERIIENLLPALGELVELVPASHREKTRAMANATLKSLQQANVPTHVAGPVLAIALEQIMSAVLQHSQGLRAQGGRHPSDPKDVS